MKIKIWLGAVVTVAALALITGCRPQNEQAAPIPNIGTNAVNTASAFTNGVSIDQENMRLALTTGLEEGQDSIFLGRGLYFFRGNSNETLDTIAAYTRQHANIVLIVAFPAGENFGKAWYVGYGSIDLTDFPKNLSVSNGTFAVFRDK